MKKTFLSISLLAALFTVPLISSEVAKPNATEDLKAILHKTFLNTKAEPFLLMVATDAIAQSGKEMDAEDLVVKFKEAFNSADVLAKLEAPYKAIFSDEEIHQLRGIIETPVFEKYSHQGTEAFQANFMTIQETIKDLAVKYGVEKKAEEETATNVIEVTEENFEKVVGASEKPVIIDFYSTSCPPCRMMDPILKDLSIEHKDSVQFVKINCDLQPALAAQYEIKQLPTILFLKKGEKAVSMKTTGFTSKNDMNTKIADFVQTTSPEEKK